MINNTLLSELLYPDAKPVKFWEDKYPKRKTNGEVTRFAPSPTGYLHVGHVFQAVIDIALARQTSGVSILRIEDTDRKRFVSDAVKVIFDTLKIYDLNFSEGTLEGGDKGNYAPYTQTDRLEIYHSFAKHLVGLGFAYPCFCSKEDDDALRKTQGENVETGYYGKFRKCHDLTVEQVKKNLEKDMPFTIRFRARSKSLDEKIEVTDAIRGKMNIQRWFKDDVLIKSDGIPVYHFAHIIDDYLMRVTSVVRGSEWFGTYALHVEILKAFGFPMPKYYHTMLLCKHENGNRVKFSKRKHPDAMMSYYTKEGYPKEALMEYMYTLLNSSAFEEWRKNNPSLPYSCYNLDFSKMNGTEALWDLVKLDSISRQAISKMTNVEVYKYLLFWAQSYDKEFAKLLLNDKETWLEILNIDRTGERPRADLSKFSEIKDYFDYFYGFRYTAKFNEDEKKILQEYSEIYSDLDDKETWWNKIKTDDKEQTKALAKLIRKAITDRENTPDLFSIMKILGSAEVKNRLLTNR